MPSSRFLCNSQIRRCRSRYKRTKTLHFPDRNQPNEWRYGGDFPEVMRRMAMADTPLVGKSLANGRFVKSFLHCRSLVRLLSNAAAFTPTRVLPPFTRTR